MYNSRTWRKDDPSLKWGPSMCDYREFKSTSEALQKAIAHINAYDYNKTGTYCIEVSREIPCMHCNNGSTYEKNIIEYEKTEMLESRLEAKKKYLPEEYAQEMRNRRKEFWGDGIIVALLLAVVVLFIWGIKN